MKIIGTFIIENKEYEVRRMMMDFLDGHIRLILYTTDDYASEFLFLAQDSFHNIIKYITQVDGYCVDMDIHFFQVHGKFILNAMLHLKSCHFVGQLDVKKEN